MINPRYDSTETNGTIHKLVETFSSETSRYHMSKAFRINLRKVQD